MLNFNIFFGPLLQFDIVENKISCIFNFLNFFFSSEFDFSFLLMLFFFLIYLLNTFYNFKIKQSANLDFNFEELLVDIIKKKNYNYIDLLYFFFSFIFLFNITGIFPYTQTITAQLIVTLFFSIYILLIIWLHSLYNSKILMLNHFLPNGSPLLITPFIIAIEIISNLSRIISLSVRLFANMTSGHALLKILAGFGLGCFSLIFFWKFLIIFPFSIIFIITILELIIAFLQTYVFVTLVLIYISEQE